MTKPTHQQPQPPAEQERCETCGFEQRWPRPRILNDDATQMVYCPSDFHSQVEDGEQKGGGADGREEEIPSADATSGPDSKPLSEDEGRDSSQDSEQERWNMTRRSEGPPQPVEQGRRGPLHSDGDDDPRVDWGQGEWYEETQRLEAALTAAHQQIEGLQRQAEEARSTERGLITRAEAAEADLAQARAEAAELQERVRELEEALRSLLDSLSWDAVEYEHWTVDDDPVQEAKAALTAQEQGPTSGEQGEGE